MPVYYIIWRNFCAYIEILTPYCSQDMLNFYFSSGKCVSHAILLFLGVKKRFLVF